MNDEPKYDGLDVGVPPWALLLSVIILLAMLLGKMVLGNGGGGQRSTAPRPAPWPGWSVLGLALLGILALLALGVVLYALIRMVISACSAAHQARYQREIDALTVQRETGRLVTDQAREALHAARILPFDGAGRLGALVRQTASGWQVVNLDAEAGSLLLRDSGPVDRVLADPLTLAQLQARHELETVRARAATHPQLTTYSPHVQISSGDLTAELPAPAVQWPERVWLRDLAPDPPSIARLVLGLAVGDDGGFHPLTAALSDLVHVAVGGSSGWGKSVFLRALALQATTAAEPCQLALVDLEGATFAPFAAAGRLLWPVADTESAALAIMAELVKEMDRRKELYTAHPGVDSLTAYNARTDDRLPPVLCLIDEATALLSDRSVHNATRTLALRARKYGLWLVLGGQDWKAASIDTAIRNQLSSRVHFKAQSASQSRVLLGDGCAAAIETPGRAWAQLPGRPMTEFQAPMVTVGDIEAGLTGQSGPAEDLPEGDAAALLSDLDAHLVLWAVDHNGGRFSVRAVADAHQEQLSRRDVQSLADRLTLSGWLTTPTKAGTAPEVTFDLEQQARARLGS